MFYHLKSPLMTLACMMALSLAQSGGLHAAEVKNDKIAAHGGGGGGGHYGGGGGHYSSEGYHGEYHGNGSHEGDHNYNRSDYNRNYGDHNYNHYDNHWDNQLNHNNWEGGGWGGEVYTAPLVLPNNGYVLPDGGTPVYNSSGDMDTLYDYNNSINPTTAPSGSN